MERSATNSGKTIPIMLALVFVLLYLLPLGQRPLTIPDEARYAEIPREMIASGDWVAPHLVGLRYFEKPPLGYWANAISMQMFGENTFAVRLPGALAAGLSALLIFVFMKSLFNSPRVAGLAALVYLSYLLIYLVGTLNVLDNLLSLFLTSGIMAFIMACGIDGKGRNSLYTISAGVLFGLAFLTKGFLAFAVPVLVLVPWLVWHKKASLIVTRGWLAIVAAILVALPWSILIHQQEGDFWHYFFWTEHVQRFFAEDAQHKSPVYFLAMLMPILAFPWISLFPAAIAGLHSAATENANERPVIRLLWLWLLLPFLFFSVSSGKLATYILPCMPPMAMLTAVGLHRYFSASGRRLFLLGALLNALFVILVLLALLAPMFFSTGYYVYGEGESGRSFLMIVVSLLSAAAAVMVVINRKTRIRLLGTALLCLPVIVMSNIAFPNQARESKAPGDFIRAFHNQVTDTTLVISDSAMFQAVAWYLQRDDLYLVSMGEVDYGLAYADAAHRYLDAPSFKKLLDKNAGRSSVILFCRLDCDKELVAMLPKFAQTHRSGRFVAYLLPAKLP